MKLKPSLLLLFLVACSSTAARADTFIILPSGQLAFVLEGSTQASFSCAPGVPCSAAGNSVTLGTGANTTTFVASGVTLNALVQNVQTPITLATIQTIFTGTGFAGVGNLNTSLAFLRITLTQISPTPFTVPHGAVLRGGPDIYFLYHPFNRIVTRTGPNPPGFSYEFINFSLPGPTTVPVGAITNVTAQVSAIPEPTTLVLLGTGLAGVVGAARRRRGAVR